MKQGCSGFQSFLALIGRICLSLFFIVAAIQKIMNFKTVLATFPGAGSGAEWLLILAIVFELVGGIFVLFGVFARFGALLLLIFAVVATFLFHGFSAAQGAPPAAGQALEFLKNITIWGGLLYIMAFGPGGCGFDRCRKRDCSTSA